MRENVAPWYGFSHFRQVKSGIRCKNTRCVRYVRYTRYVLQNGSTLAQDRILMVNYFLSTSITIFPDGLLIYKEPAANCVGFTITTYWGPTQNLLQKHY